MTWGPFCRAKSGFWGATALQNEEPATNLARGFLHKIRAPNPLFLVHFCDFQSHWPLQSGEPDMSTHLSRIATWNKASPQKYKDLFCRGVMWKNPGLPWKPWNLQKSILYIFMHMNVDTPQNLYRMRNLQFQPTTTCSLSKIRNL